ncbi:MAG: hypothetical protein WBE02_14000, partial [Bradyrhizobium sp.]
CLIKWILVPAASHGQMRGAGQLKETLQTRTAIATKRPVGKRGCPTGQPLGPQFDFDDYQAVQESPFQ